MSSVGSIKRVGRLLRQTAGMAGFENRLRRVLGAAALTLVLVPTMAVAHAQAAPAWSLHVAGVDRAAPGSSFTYRIAPRNIGDAATDGTGRVEVTLPEGLTGVSVESGLVSGSAPLTWTCSDPTVSPTITCDTSFAVDPGRPAIESLALNVSVDPEAPGSLSTSFSVSGGGAATGASVSQTFSADPQSRFSLTGFDGAVSDASGGAYTQAGGHPDSASVSFSLSRVMKDGYARADGGDLREAQVDLPPGFIGNPEAVPACPSDLRIPSHKQALEGASTRTTTVRSAPSSGRRTSR